MRPKLPLPSPWGNRPEAATPGAASIVPPEPVIVLATSRTAPPLPPPPGPPPPGRGPAPPAADTIRFAPDPPANPPGPPTPTLFARRVPLAVPTPPADPLTSIVPAMVTFPLARIVTGVFAALRVKVTVTPAGMFTVVKLKTPLAGNVSVVLAVGLKAPSAPVLPLLNVCATAGPPPSHHAVTQARIASHPVRIARALLP